MTRTIIFMDFKIYIYMSRSYAKCTLIAFIEPGLLFPQITIVTRFYSGNKRTNRLNNLFETGSLYTMGIKYHKLSVVPLSLVFKVFSVLGLGLDSFRILDFLSRRPFLFFRLFWFLPPATVSFLGFSPISKEGISIKSVTVYRYWCKFSNSMEIQFQVTLSLVWRQESSLIALHDSHISLNNLFSPFNAFDGGEQSQKGSKRLSTALNLVSVVLFMMGSFAWCFFAWERATDRYTLYCRILL